MFVAATSAVITLGSASSEAKSARAICNGARATIIGTSGTDRLTGTPRRDVIVGRGGNDVIDGAGGNDVICGGSGADVLLGGVGSDALSGGQGKDFVAGEAGNDRLRGGPGRDTCSQNVGRGRIAGCENVVTRAATLAPGQPLRTGAEAAALVRRTEWEPRPENEKANHTVPTERVPWTMTQDQLYWKKWIRKRNRVTGAFTGATDEILQWGAYKWGIDEDVIRAVAVRESNWRQSTVGDHGGTFGIMGVKDHYADGSLDHGGYPWTSRATALNVDFFGARIRACLTGDFYDGGQWLYGGKRVRGDLWGCLGAWYSGGWYDAGSRRYVAQVKAILAPGPWRHWRG